VSQSFLNVAESFTSAVTQDQDNPYTIDNLFPEGFDPYRAYLLSSGAKRGVSLPQGRDARLLSAADDLVKALNKIYQEKGHDASIELRASIANNTACLSRPSSGDSGHIHDQIWATSDLQIALRIMEIDRTDPLVSQEVAPKLRRFVQTFAETEGASEYTSLALNKMIFNADTVIKLESARIKDARSGLPSIHP